jgi:hypothetical protein
VVAKDAKSPYVEGTRETWHWPEDQESVVQTERACGIPPAEDGSLSGLVLAVAIEV